MNKEKWLSVTEAKQHIEEKYGEEKLPLTGGAVANLFAALKSGSVTAKGIYQIDILTSSKISQTIPIDYWRKQHLVNFISPIQLPNEPCYKDISLLAADIDKWLIPNRITNAPKPLTAARGVYVRPKEYYSVPVKESDYIRCITDGVIKVHCLAALACDLSPPENTGDGSAPSKLYTIDFLNSERPLGLICNKLVQAIQTNKLSIISKGYNAGYQWHLISLTHSVAWLNKQPGIIISERLKQYIAEHLQPKSKPADIISKFDRSNLETFWNIPQSLCWIIFRDLALVNDYADETRTVSHLEIRSIYRRHPDTEERPPILSYKNAIQQLLQRCGEKKLLAHGYKNNEGNIVPMGGETWINADMYDDGNRTYVSAKDHVTAIGRTQWYGVTFNKQDILKEWPALNAKAAECEDETLALSFCARPFSNKRERNEFIKKEMAIFINNGKTVDNAAYALFDKYKTHFIESGIKTFSGVRRKYYAGI